MNWIVKIGKDLVQAFTDPYRPELHYMRGPGPAWRAKHGQPPAQERAGDGPAAPGRRRLQLHSRTVRADMDGLQVDDMVGGHGHLGLTQAAATARIVADLEKLTGRRINLKIEDRKSTRLNSSHT